MPYNSGSGKWQSLSVAHHEESALLEHPILGKFKPCVPVCHVNRISKAAWFLMLIF